MQKSPIRNLLTNENEHFIYIQIKLLKRSIDMSHFKTMES